MVTASSQKLRGKVLQTRLDNYVLHKATGTSVHISCQQNLGQYKLKGQITSRYTLSYSSSAAYVCPTLVYSMLSMGHLAIYYTQHNANFSRK